MEPFSRDQTRSASDFDNARRLIEFTGSTIRYCSDWGRWLVWNGKRWEIDDTGEVDRRALYVAGELSLLSLAGGDKDIRRQAARAGSWSGVTSTVRLASKFPGVTLPSSAFDADPWLLNCQNCMVNLREGGVQPHDPAALCTRITGADYPEIGNPNEDTQHEFWSQRVYDMLNRDYALWAWVRNAVGYSLTGCTREQCLMFLYGMGCNGKSLFLETIRAAAGTYACVVAPGLLLDAEGDQHPTGIADLQGRRLAITSEVGEGKRLAEELVKRLTGTDTLKARLMHCNFWEFAPTHKLWLAANHKPAIRGTDEGIWRRIRLVPFNVQFVEKSKVLPGGFNQKDPELADKLREEHLPYVLWWAVGGAMDWLGRGFYPCKTVDAAVQEYRDEQDTFGQYLRECVEEWPGGRVLNPELWESYETWCHDNGEKYPLGRKKFTQELLRRGYQQGSDTALRAWVGIRLLTSGQRDIQGAMR